MISGELNRKVTLKHFMDDLMVIQAICKRGTTCSDCPFEIDDGCPFFDGTPDKWNLDGLYKMTEEGE